MMFAAAPAGPHRPGLHVILATAHVPLAAVPRTLTTARITEVILLGARAMRDLGVPDPRVGVCGLNPHAGERGVLGPEDDAIIAPAIALARAQGINASGPFPGDTIFPGALASAPSDAAAPGSAAPASARPPRFDLVVAMYHDQGLIPVKLLAFDRAVNVTVGLRWHGRDVVRTSPDHGTAYDIAGRNIADAGSMRAAMDLAITWAARANEQAATAPRTDVNALRGTLTLTEEPIDSQRRTRGGPSQPPNS
jgi:4-hydroxythreonine-4-phosphate dehydrogenase